MINIRDRVQHKKSGEFGVVVSLQSYSNYPRGSEDKYFIMWDNGDCAWVLESEIRKVLL